MIAECGKALVQLLQSAMIPLDIQSPELITLRIPQLQDQDYVIGIYLYHIDEDVQASPQPFIDMDEHHQQYPNKVITLSYVVFVNEEATFGGFQKEQEDRLLERIIQVFHDEHELTVETKSCNLHFDHLDLDSRIRLWQSFSKPLQPAVYVRIHHVLIASRKSKEVHRVHKTIVTSERKDS